MGKPDGRVMAAVALAGAVSPATVPVAGAASGACLPGAAGSAGGPRVIQVLLAGPVQRVGPDLLGLNGVNVTGPRWDDRSFGAVLYGLPPAAAAAKVPKSSRPGPAPSLPQAKPR